jgi:calcineurin-like phosphoesterase family protein
VTIDAILSALSPRVLHRVWVMSDLQQALPAKARRCLSIAVDDFRRLAMPCERIWYLGDAVEGTNADHLAEMCRMQLEVLGSLNVPLRYVTGNHDFDHAMFGTESDRGRPRPFFWEAVKSVPTWKTTDSLDSLGFFDELGEYLVVFLSDHADPAGRWVTTHGKLQRGPEHYPYAREDYQAITDAIARSGKRTITAAHYAFPGGNRPSDLLAQMLPLPPNVKLHLYGHAHIGDAAWAKEHLYRKVSCVDHHKAPQVDVASLEDDRGSEVRSVILEIYDDHTLAVYFRDHGRGAWADAYHIADER